MGLNNGRSTGTCLYFNNVVELNNLLRFKNKRMAFTADENKNYTITDYWSAFEIDKTKVSYYSVGIMHQSSGCIHMSSIRFLNMYHDGTAEIFPVSASNNGWANDGYGSIYTGSCRFNDNTIKIGSLGSGNIFLLYLEK